MNNTNSQKIKLGLFVIIGTLIFVAAVYLIGQRQNMFKKTFTISSYFQNVKGLQKGNNVRYSGIVIGTVQEIEMLNDTTIKVEMDIDEKIISHIKKDAIATIGSDGLVGSMIINIVPGDRLAPVIVNGDIIKSYSKIGTDDILSTLSVGTENAAILTSDLLKITNKIIKGKGTIGVLINDSLMAKDLKTSIHSLRTATGSANQIIAELQFVIKDLKIKDDSVLGILLKDSISGIKLKSALKNLEDSSVEIKKTVSNINHFVTTIDSSKGAFNYLVKDSILVNELKSTFKNIQESTDKFNQNMEALKHNFLTRGYFRKLEREEKKEIKKNKINN